MEQNQHTYNLRVILIAVLIWEVVFWSVYFGLYFFLIDQVEAFRFEWEAALWGLLSIPLFLSGYLFLIRWKNTVLERLADNRLIPFLTQPVSSIKSFWRFFFFRNALTFLIIALANPQFGKGTTKAVSE